MIAVLRATCDIPDWFVLASLLGVSSADVERIRSDVHGALNQQKAIIKKWLDLGEASWAILVSALRDNLVEKVATANAIAKQHPSCEYNKLKM